MIKKHFLKIFSGNRKLIFAKVTIVFALVLMVLLSFAAYLEHNMTIFYYDLAVFLVIFISYILSYKKNIFVSSYLSLFIITLGYFGLLYISKGTNGVILWVYPLISFYMFTFGHKRGSIFSAILAILTFIIMYSWIDESYTKQFYIRYIIASFVIYALFFTYEYVISKTQKELKNMTRTDALTTLFNRRYFDETFPKQIKIAKRNHKLLVFAMLDIDYFKKYNDEYGHQAGDATLKEVSFSFKKTINRPDDYVFRLGGEEFGVLFSSDSKEKAVELIEQMRENIQNLKIAHIGNDASPFVTVSIGLYISKPSENSDYETIYKICDDALYVAKTDGRNRVKLAQS